LLDKGENEMKLLTNKELEKIKLESWKKGNSDATKAWQKEFENYKQEMETTDKSKMEYIEHIINDYVIKLRPTLKKADMQDLFEKMCEELLDFVKEK
jgi:hypothetical protein